MFSGTHSALRPSPLKVLPVAAADTLTEPDIVKGDHPRSALRTKGEARLGGQRMHKSRDGRGENEGKGAFLLRKGFQRESFTLVQRTREGTREGGRKGMQRQSALLAQSGPSRPPLCILGSAVLPGQQHSARGSTRLPRNSTTTTTTTSARRNRVSQSATTALARQNIRLQNGIRVHGVSRER